jgi:hypothetical protein
MCSIAILSGCSTPFKGATSTNINPSTASRVTVQSTTTSSLKKSIGNDYSMASVSINGEFVGEFSRSEKSFSYEMNPGPISMDFCLDGYTPRCLNYRVTVEPNKHYFLEYSFDSQFIGVGSSIQRKVNVNKIVPYGNVQTQIAVEKNPQLLQSNQKSAIPNQVGVGLETAKKKCIELGFKSGTESFGQCILKLSN